MNRSELEALIKPAVIGWIDETLDSAYSMATGGSTASSGVLDASQYPDALLRDGSRSLLQSLDIADGALVDGRDVSVDGATLDTHLVATDPHTQYASANGSGTRTAYRANSVSKNVNGGAGLVNNGGNTLLTNDVTLDVGAGTGITVNADNVAVDQAFSPTWTGSHTFNQSTSLSHALPRTNDTYDLGSEALRWRQAFVSELETILLKQKAVMAVDGAIILGKQNGTFNGDITAVQTQIDFGTTMIPNDFLYVAGNNKIEYMQVGTLVSGTTYNVTRNVDGSGADAWTSGQAWISFGYNGDTRIEISKANGIRLLRQGTTYNSLIEIVTLDADGLSVIAGTAGSDLQSYKFTDSSGTVLSRIAAYLIGASNYLETKVEKTNVANQVSATAKSTTGYGAVSDIIAIQGNKIALVRASIDTTGLAQSIASADRHQWQLDRFYPASSHAFTGAVSDEYVWNTALRSWWFFDGTAYHQISIPAFNGAFPSSPRDKMRVFRSDLDAEYFWNAATSQWLSSTLFTAELVETRVLAPYTNANIGTSDTFVLIYHLDNRNSAVRITNSYFFYQVGATNNATNYYTYRVDISANAGVTSNLINEANTSTLAANAKGVVTVDDTTIAQNNNGARSSIILKKVGTPTNFTFRGVLKYRLIG